MGAYIDFEIDAPEVSTLLKPTFSLHSGLILSSWVLDFLLNVQVCG